MAKRNDRQKTVDVVICGGGPVGLAMCFLLGRAGVNVRLFEKRSGTTHLPKGQYVHASTAELYRQWGVWEQLRNKGWSIHRSNGQGFYVRVANGPVAEVRQAFGSEAEYEQKWAKLSPAYPRKVPASDYEAALLEQACSWPTVEIAFDSRVIAAHEVDSIYTLEVRDETTGDTREVSAHYVIACDGAHSFIRNQLGSGEDHGPAFENQVLVEFRASLEDTLGKDGFFHSFVMDPRYAGWFGSEHPDSRLWRYSFRHDEDELPPEEVIIDRIRGALGMPDEDIQIEKYFRFDYTTGLVRKWREGNVFFAGDAAHWHSPWGGFGANIGVQDANNLAWKLALVIRGDAAPDLLDTYEVERKPKALQAVKAATYNSLHYQAIVQATLVGDQEMISQGLLSAAGTKFLNEKIKPHGFNAVLHTGFQLGTVYKSKAIISDRDVQPPEATLADYIESTAPGCRAPHVWLRDRHDRQLSLVDLFGERFVLLVSDHAEDWTHALQALAQTSDFPKSLLEIIEIGDQADFRAEDGKFSDLYEAPLIIRPDGFIAGRFNGRPRPDGTRFIRETFERILGRNFVFLTAQDSDRVLSPELL